MITVQKIAIIVVVKDNRGLSIDKVMMKRLVKFGNFSMVFILFWYKIKLGN
jgi:hypothetical protein